jgi:hypothetical protein
MNYNIRSIKAPVQNLIPHYELRPRDVLLALIRVSAEVLLPGSTANQQLITAVPS